MIDDGSLLRCRRKQHAQRGNSGAAVISSPPTEIAAPASPSTAELPFARQFLHWKDASIASAILQQLAEAASGVSSHTVDRGTATLNSWTRGLSGAFPPLPFSVPSVQNRPLKPRNHARAYRY